MGKALVIKGTNFSINKLDTVNLSDNVPCTGLSLNQSAITFIAFTTEQLTATKVPANTSDIVTWASSDTNVVTVNDGLVTCVGVGTATITATCGEQTATCSVSSTITIVLDTAYYAENYANYSGSMDLSVNPPKNHIGRSSSNKARLFYSTEPYGTYQAFAYPSLFENQYLIPLPKGATQATLIFPTGLEKRHVNFILGNSNEKQTYVTGADGNSALGIQPYTYYSNTASQIDIDISEYASQANGFIASWSFISSSQTDPATITGTTTIIFS